MLFFISGVLGLVSMASSLLLLWAALDSPNEGSLFKKMGLPVPDYGQIVTMIYLKVSLSDFLTLFSARTNPGPFWSQKPGKLLMAAATIALALSTILACIWPKGELDEVLVEGLTLNPDYKLWPLWVWLFCIVFWFVQDALKVVAYYFLYKYDIFQARTAALVNVRGYTAPGQGKLTAEATGMVEKKLLGRKVDNAIAAVENITKNSMGGKVPPALARMSQTLALARTSISPVTAPSPEGIPAQAIADINDAAAQIGPHISAADQATLQTQLQGVQDAAANLRRVSAVLQKPAK